MSCGNSHTVKRDRRSGRSIRWPVRDWLLCWQSFRAGMNLLAVILLSIAVWHARGQSSREWVVWRAVFSLAAALLVLRPLVYFVFPVLMTIATIIIIKVIDRRSGESGCPCPICGYDVRETLSRCPECGTELRWGQLPGEQTRRRR